MSSNRSLPTQMQASRTPHKQKFATALQVRKRSLFPGPDRIRRARDEYALDPFFPRLPKPLEAGDTFLPEAQEGDAHSSSDEEFEAKATSLRQSMPESILDKALEPDFFDQHAERLCHLHDAVWLVTGTSSEASHSRENDNVLMNTFEALVEDADDWMDADEEEMRDDAEDLALFLARLARAELEFAWWVQRVTEIRQSLQLSRASQRTAMQTQNPRKVRKVERRIRLQECRPD